MPLGGVQVIGEMPLQVPTSVLARSPFEPSAKDNSSNNTNPHTYSYACTDAAYCCANTYTDSRPDPKC
jgi:hypothetical protein